MSIMPSDVLKIRDHFEDWFIDPGSDDAPLHGYVINALIQRQPFGLEGCKTH